MPAVRGPQFPKSTVTPVRDMTKVGGSESTIVRMTPALGTGRATVYRKLSDSEGYPRGYNPAQMQEVRDVEASGMLEIEGSNHYGTGKRDEAIVRESIARSKINPKETFTDPLKVVTTPAFIDAKGRFNHKHDVVANQSGKHKITIQEGMSLRDAGTDNTLTHEIGHYVDRDNVHKGWSLTNTWEKAEHAGSLEGIADAYARENSVEDPRNVRKNKTGTKQMSGYPAFAGLAQHAVPGTDTWSWGKGYLSSGGEALDRGSPRWEAMESAGRVPGGEGPRARYRHPETQAPITGGSLLEYMRGTSK